MCGIVIIRVMAFSDSLTTLQSVFSNIGARDIFDILIVAILIYIAIIFIKQTRSFFIFSTIIILLGVSYLSGVFDLTLTRTVLQPFLTFFFLILIIVFQREIRRFFEWFSISGRELAIQRGRSISSEVFDNIVDTVSLLAKEKIGALIVLSGKHPLEHSIQGGHALEGRVSVPLLLSIFDTRSPGHDGAVIITGNRVKRFGVHLPLTQKFDSLNKAGTRHRAAIGVTEETDALVIVVSEERGSVSVAANGVLKEVSRDIFRTTVEGFIQEQIVENNHYKNIRYDILAKNWVEKLSALFLSLILWLTLAL